MEASKEISKERNRRPVRSWLNYNDPDGELSQEEESPEGRVDGRWSWRSCRSIPYVYMSCVCHALFANDQNRGPFFAGVD